MIDSANCSPLISIKVSQPYMKNLIYWLSSISAKSYPYISSLKELKIIIAGYVCDTKNIAWSCPTVWNYFYISFRTWLKWNFKKFNIMEFEILLIQPHYNKRFWNSIFHFFIHNIFFGSSDKHLNITETE